MHTLYSSSFSSARQSHTSGTNTDKAKANASILQSLLHHSMLTPPSAVLPIGYSALFLSSWYGIYKWTKRVRFMLQLCFHSLLCKLPLNYSFSTNLWHNPDRFLVLLLQQLSEYHTFEVSRTRKTFYTQPLM